MSVCKSCEKPIRWVVIAKTGKKMPLDVVEGRVDGTIRLLGSSDGQSGLPLAAFIERGDTVPLTNRWLSHFATCPHAAAHRTAS